MASRRPKEPPTTVSELSRRSLRKAPNSKKRWFSLSFSLVYGSSRFWTSVSSRRPGDFPDRPKRVQSSSQMSQESSKMAPTKPKTDHRPAITPQESLRLAHDGARRDPRPGPRLPQNGPKRPSRRRRRPSDGPKEPQDGPRGFTTAQMTAPQEPRTVLTPPNMS